jgi:hypothetical protein
MVRLPQRFRLTNLARKHEYRQQCLGLAKTSKSIDIDQWLQNWETTYDECKKLYIPDVAGDNATHTFLAVVATISRDFVSSYNVSIAQGIVFLSLEAFSSCVGTGEETLNPKYRETKLYLVPFLRQF